MNGTIGNERQRQFNEWSVIVQECEESGLSVRAYCEQRGIGVKTYYYWRKKLRELSSKSAQPEIVQVEVPVQHKQSGIIIKTSNISIEIPCSATPKTVRAAVSFLRQL